ncbi:SOS response-associated peptidase [Corynebacterium belfantii]|uniref:Abasic site processing protein n=1 Tax=Corynebacterium belfantii TaxID=2014537 RepID=A0ABS0L9N4_9CORY|nr:SOS response-associated peptidase [Corynebacterium belfantii]QVI99922.1 SOS response-associated peptidase [Corynebacterium diphtheriae]SPJ40057.1 Putative SOS response-associated peptidase YedK [Corynebacterium diphtheriae subsp. lausannense]MBG9258412.1 SOS response-associated peptidase [Corynebacterium belfantii]MBG9265043.1 SOS response-associated peptidase [Corynebacterium belfantii]MBG9287937.1 SOS response-associated peptidase [Corynebacterium belfantii]
MPFLHNKDMCGRFVLFTTDESLLGHPALRIFHSIHAPKGMPPARYNIAPTTIIPVLRVGTTPTEVVIEPARWGLIPVWKREVTSPPLFNARAETVTTKPSFRQAFRTQRCAIPMDGYYEWHNEKPYWITTGAPTWVAGLWDSGAGMLSATMITTDSVAPLDWLHHRMPRFLNNDELAVWLRGSADEASGLLTPGDASAFHTSPADPSVGNIRNDYPELIDAPTDLFSL